MYSAILLLVLNLRVPKAPTLTHRINISYLSQGYELWKGVVDKPGVNSLGVVGCLVLVDPIRGSKRILGDLSDLTYKVTLTKPADALAFVRLKTGRPMQVLWPSNSSSNGEAEVMTPSDLDPSLYDSDPPTYDHDAQLPKAFGDGFGAIVSRETFQKEFCPAKCSSVKSGFEISRILVFKELTQNNEVKFHVYKVSELVAVTGRYRLQHCQTLRSSEIKWSF